MESFPLSTLPESTKDSDMKDVEATLRLGVFLFLLGLPFFLLLFFGDMIGVLMSDPKNIFK